MPIYSYKCRDCKKNFQVVHSIKEKWAACLLCESKEIEKAITLFAANTETTLESKQRHYDIQKERDLDKFQKDDKFAMNITGQDDPNSEKRKQGLIADQQKKQAEKLAKIKQGKWNFNKN